MSAVTEVRLYKANSNVSVNDRVSFGRVVPANQDNLLVYDPEVGLQVGILRGPDNAYSILTVKADGSSEYTPEMLQAGMVGDINAGGDAQDRGMFKVVDVRVISPDQYLDSLVQHTEIVEKRFKQERKIAEPFVNKFPSEEFIYALEHVKQLYRRDIQEAIKAGRDLEVAMSKANLPPLPSLDDILWDAK